MKYEFYSEDKKELEELRQCAMLDRLVTDRELRIQEIENGVIIPGKGIYKDGHFFSNSNWGGVVDDTEINIIEYDIEDCDDEVYYLGTFHGIWGHAITDGKRLLWGLLPELSGQDKTKYAKFVYGKVGVETHLPDNLMALLSYLGINPDNSRLITKPARFKKIFLANEAYWYDINTAAQRTFSPTFRNFYEILCQRIAGEDVKPYRIVYLSRSNWRKGNRDFGEHYLEDAFQNKYNCEIIHPQDLSFKDLVTVLRQTKTLITTEGSISHNALFLQPGTKLIILRKAGFISYYQLMVNQLKELDVTYIDAHRTHHFYNSPTPYYGPFFIYKNKALAKFLETESYFPILTYLKYRGHVAKAHTRYFLGKTKRKIKQLIASK